MNKIKKWLKLHFWIFFSDDGQSPPKMEPEYFIKQYTRADSSVYFKIYKNYWTGHPIPIYYDTDYNTLEEAKQGLERYKNSRTVKSEVAYSE